MPAPRALLPAMLAAALLGAACQQPTPVPKNLAPLPGASPSAVASPSPAGAAGDAGAAGAAGSAAGGAAGAAGGAAAPGVATKPGAAAAAASPTPVVLGKQPFAVVIDNIAAARPQSGLAEANFVYEAPAEGGIPRILAIFLQEPGTNRIGPVRSARPYFVQIAKEFGAALVHVGFSPQALAMMNKVQTVRVDDGRGDLGFYRDDELEAPHNDFVSTSGVREQLDAAGATLKASTSGVTFGKPKVVSTDSGVHLRIAYPGGEQYVVQYDYKPGSGTYLREMDGAPHVDAVTGEQYAAKTVIVQFVRVTAVPNDPTGRLDIGLTGTGEALAFFDGTVQKLKWTKENDFGATRFRLPDNSPLIVPGGQVWVQIVPTGTELQRS